MTITRSLSWAAVSSKPQAQGESLADQHRLNHALAEALEWEIIADITVPGESRSYYRLSEASENIAAYRQLADYAQGDNIEWLIVKDRSRLGRTRRLNQEAANYLQDHGIRIYSRALPPASVDARTEADVWGEAIESGFSEAEIFRLRQRHAMGMRARIKSGKFPATPPWGFHRLLNDGQESVVFQDPLAERVVRFVIDKYHLGISKKHIVETANAQHFRAPQGGPVVISTVNRIIYQPAYYSLTAYNRRSTVTRDGKKVRIHTPIRDWLIEEAEFVGPYTPQDWERTIREHERRSAEHPRRLSTAYVLSGIAWCAACDCAMIGSSSNARKRYLYYQCHGPEPPRSDHPWTYGSGPHRYRADQIHRSLAEFLRGSDITEVMAFASETEDRGNWLSEREMLIAQGADIAKRRRRWMDAYEADILDLDAFAERVKEIDTEEEALERQLARLDQIEIDDKLRADYHKELSEHLDKLPAMLEQPLSTTDETHEILRATCARLFRRIWVEDGVVTRVSLPLTP